MKFQRILSRALRTNAGSRGVTATVRSNDIFGLALLAAAGWLFLAAVTEVDAGTVTGRVVYSNVNQSLEKAVGDNGEAASIFLRGLSDNAPVPHVQVELWGATSIAPVDTYVTDEDGSFSLQTSAAHATPNTLKVKALNDYVEVKESKVIPLSTDKAIHADFAIYGGDYDADGNANLEEVEIDDDTHSFTAAGGTFPVSRALFVASSVYRAARHIEELTGETLPPIYVRLGYWLGGAWYDIFTGPNTIHLQGEVAADIDHEYGHHIEDTIGAFGIIPSYIPIPWSHNVCDELTTDCWAFLEGLASWYGAVNSLGFTNVSGVSFFGDPEATSYLEALGDNWWVEDGSCSTSWAHPESVELVVAQVLWDLVDDHEETGANKPPEVAAIPITDVLAVLRTTGIFLPCWPTQPIYAHPVTLEQFAQTYLNLHAGEAVHPDIYAAFAFNGVEGVGGVEDTASPDAVTLTSTHAEGAWTNSAAVGLTITDGNDDFSGSFYYWQLWDTQATTTIDDATAEIGTEDFPSKATVNTSSFTLAEGDRQYVHVQTRDLAGHLGTTAHYGPVRIDLTKPYWISHEFPMADKANLIGTYLHFEWETKDDLSGVDYVSISYSDSANGIENVLPVKIDSASGTYEFYLNPDHVVPTTAGYFSATVWDRAGNSATLMSDTITVVSPFDGPNDLSLALDQGRVVCGDLNGDGTDEIVISGKAGLARTLQIIQIWPAVLAKDVVPGIGVAGGDLFLADIDRDGDLDIVAAGDFGGATPEIYTFQNDGTGAFLSLGALPVTALDDMVVRVVDLYGTGEPILIYGGKLGAGAAHKELRAYNLVTGGAVQFLNGTAFRGGDFEVGDINADGIFDFVTLSYDSAGNGSLDWYLGTQENQLKWTRGSGTSAVYPQIGDVDLGNWDLDNDLELFVMYYVSTPAGTEVHTELWEWTGSTFALAVEGGGANQIAEGDGHIVDIYNDGMSDVFALGRRTTGALSSWYVTNEKLGRKGTGVPYPVKRNLLYNTDTAWGDFDNDGDLDVVVTGSGPFGARSTVWYESKISTYGERNDDPPVPQNLQAFYDPARSGYVFSWEAPGVNTDETAETAFEYEIRVGTAAGLSDVVSWAHIAGHGQQVAPQYVGGPFERFVTMPFGPVDWCVRAVDSGWRRSGCGSVVPMADGVNLKVIAVPPPLTLTENIARVLRLNVTNSGSATAASVLVTVNAPAGLRFSSATNSAGTCLVTSSNVTCTVATLASNATFTVDLALRPNFLSPTSALTVNLSNLTAVVSSTAADLNPADNSLALPVTVRAQTDWADARGGGFPVTEAENGAYHRYAPTAPWLGLRWDNDGSGNHSLLADFDDTHGVTDDEDGILFLAPLMPGITATVIVTCTNAPGFLDTWADFNGNTNWADAGEQIFTNQLVAPGINTLTFAVPSNAVVGTITTRWRLSTTGGLSYTGYGGVGEVEDHLATISALPTPVVVSGLSHATLGQATVSSSSNAVLISNLGSSGQDGVSIPLGRANGWRTELVHELNASHRANGSRIEWTAYGEKNGQADQLLIRGRLERSDDCLALYADASPMGATAFRLEVLSNQVVVARTTVNSGRIARLRVPAGTLPRVPDSLVLDWDAVAGRNYCWHRWFFDEDLTGRACEVVLGDLPDTVDVIRNADSLRLSAINPTATMGALSRVEFRGMNSGDFWLNDEAIGHLGVYLHTEGGTTFLTESNRLRFLPDSNGVIQARALASMSTDMTRHGLAFHTPGLALAAPGSAATFRVGDATSSFGALTLSRGGDGTLAVNGRFAFTGEVNRVVVEMFASTSRVARISLPAGALGTLSGVGRIITAGAAQGRVPTLSVVFDAPMSFAHNTPMVAAAGAVAQTATGFRVYPDLPQVFRVFDRFDVETLHEELQEWFDQVIIASPGGTKPTLDRVVVGEHPRLSFASEAGVEYVVQSWDTLDGTAPATLQRVTGTGGVLLYEDGRSAHGVMRFYRVVPVPESLWEGLRGMW